LFDFTIDRPWHGFPPASKLSFTNDGYDEIVDGLRSLPAAELAPAIGPLVEAIRNELFSLDGEVKGINDAKDRRPNSVRRFGLARRYCLITAAAACLLTWKHNRGTGEDWLIAALQRILTRLNGGIPAELPDSLFGRMVDQHQENRLFSLHQLALGARMRNAESAARLIGSAEAGRR
jgi:hypothetical protein